jgi:hypothetical protein
MYAFEFATRVLQTRIRKRGANQIEKKNDFRTPQNEDEDRIPGRFRFSTPQMTLDPLHAGLVHYSQSQTNQYNQRQEFGASSGRLADTSLSRLLFFELALLTG